MLKALVSDNSGNNNIQMMIIAVIAFVVGAVIIAALFAALNGTYYNGTDNMIHDMLD